MRSRLCARAQRRADHVPVPRCDVHRRPLGQLRNVLSNVPRRPSGRLAREIVAVLHAENLDAARKAMKRFRDRFASPFSEAVDCWENGFEAATQYFAFPERHWMRIRSTNWLERLHGEIKRRTRAIGEV